MRTPSISDQKIIVIFSLPNAQGLRNYLPARDILQDIRELVDDLRRLGCIVNIQERK